MIPQWHIDAFLSVDVPKDLEKGLSYWVDKKINWLFDSYNTTALHYTGGTDSHTILVRAMANKHKFDSSITALGSTRGDWNYVDEDYIEAKQFLESNNNAVKKISYLRPTIELYEKVYQSDDHPAYCIPGYHFGFRPVYRYLYQDEFEHECVVSGCYKPLMFKKNDSYYWFISNNYDEYSFLKNDISFYGDGNIPQVAVLQAYKAKEFFETYMPNKLGGLSQHSIPFNLRSVYHEFLGRVEAMSESLCIGTILGKSSSLNVKNLRSMEELISLGRIDICHSWNQKRQQLIDDLHSVPYSFSLNKTTTPIDNYQSDILCPNRTARIAAIFRLDPHGLTKVSEDILHDTGTKY